MPTRAEAVTTTAVAGAEVSNRGVCFDSGCPNPPIAATSPARCYRQRQQ
jgi:hypothetical protein